MSLYKEFSSLFPYLQSVRKLKNYLSFDVSFPESWKLPKKYVEEDKILQQESQTPNEKLFSFVSEFNEEEVEKIAGNVKSIINYNLEREEKERLFQSKVDELKNVFEKQSLNNLKNLKFDIKSIQNLELEDNEDEIKPTAMATT
jgi:hypothetical protein